MRITKTAVAGTLESSDIQVTIQSNANDCIEIHLDSPVKHLFKDEIENVILDSLRSHSVKSAVVKAIDKGALNCTIAARVQSAIYRACEENELNWEAI